MRRALVWAGTLALFAFACVTAYWERGYLAMGGEMFILFIPALVKFVRIAIEEEDR